MNRWAPSLMAAVLIGLVLSIAACQEPETPDRVAGWRADLDHLVAEARRVHAGPAKPAHRAEFAQAAADLAARIPSLPDRRIAVELQRLLAMLNDGHSLVYPMPVPRSSFATLPLDLYLFHDGLFVVDGTGPAQELIGRRVVRFGSRTTEEILEDMQPFVSRDNAMGLKAFASLYLVMPAFLEAWRATDEPNRATLTVVGPDGSPRDVSLTAGSARRVRRRLFAPPRSAQPPPLYLQHADRQFWSQSLPDHRALYVQFNQVADSAEMSLAGFAAQLRETLASGTVQFLILDVRHNNGGNNFLLEPLLETVATFAAPSSTRRVYVLTSRSTFSAAQNFISRLERRVPGAIFAGEPSMSSPNFTGEDNPITLPFSGLTVSISNRYWQDADAGDRRPWIAPHLLVPLSSRDWLANTDPVLDAVLRAIPSKPSERGPRG